MFYSSLWGSDRCHPLLTARIQRVESSTARCASGEQEWEQVPHGSGASPCPDFWRI